jgi:small subunit ribosomal protein S6
LETVANKLYEAMFLVDSSLAAQDWDGILGTIEGILKRAEAEIVSLKKWGDKRLAYEIDHKARGTYILCYFRAGGGRIGDIERDVRLSERIMRVLILSTEGRALQDIEKDIAENLAEDREAEAVQAGEDIETNTAETPGEDRLVEAAQEPEVDQVSADDGRISD